LHIIFIQIIPHLTKNTLYLHYKDQSLYVVQDDNSHYKPTLSAKNMLLMLMLEVYIPLSVTGFVLMIMIMTTTYACPMLYKRMQTAHLEDYVRHIFSLPLPSFFTNLKIPFLSPHTSSPSTSPFPCHPHTTALNASSKELTAN